LMSIELLPVRKEERAGTRGKQPQPALPHPLQTYA
jgi:hypothetical protein